MNLALTGLRVVDFGQGVAGPYCAQLLADQGAEVIKIEPPRGDWSRTMGAKGPGGLSGTFISVNRNKRGLCLDFAHDEARAVARALALRADVVVESFRPGVMERLGLGHESLAEPNPRLVYCSITGFGPDGPNVDLPAGDSIMQAYGGLMSIIGERDGTPLRVGNVVSDMVAGMHAHAGVLLALLQRGTTGAGRRVRVSLLDAIVAFQAPPITEYLLTGSPPRRLGNDHPLIAPSGAARTRDGLISYTVLDHQWTRFCEGVGRPALAGDPRFADSPTRQRNRAALAKILDAVFLERSSGDWLATLRGIDVLCAPINDYAALVQDPQVVHNRIVGKTADGDGNPIPMLRNPLHPAGDAPAYAAPPRIGEHSRRILAEELGYDAEAVQALVDSRAVREPMRDPAGATEVRA